MTTCTRCGAEHSVGRFCTNCGAPREATAPAVVAPRPVQEPPPVHQPPPPQRFPLYADEASSPPPPPPAPVLPAPEPAGRHRRPRWVPWLATAVVVLMLVVIGFSLLVGGDEEPAATPSEGATSSDAGEAPSTAAPEFEGEPEELAGRATAEAPGSDADSVDITTGQPTTYQPSNMLDGDPETAWRVTGDASGDSLTFTFGRPVTLTSLGLVNGYAKTSVDETGREFDLYAGSRRVLAVEWVLDGGEPIPQTLVDGERGLQLLDVGAVEATVVELRLVEVSAPGDGAEARDKTALSEVSLAGYRS